MKKNIKGLALVAVLTALTTGCGGFTNRQAEVSSKLSDISEGFKTDVEGVPSCQIDFAEYKLDARLLSFELKDKTNVGFGYNIMSGIFKAFGVSMKVEKGEMVASMALSETLRPTEEAFIDVMGAGDSKTMNFNFDLDLVMLGLDFGYYKTTPLAALTEKTLSNTMANVRAKLNPIETAWFARAVHLYLDDGEVIIPAGTVAGIRIGDKFGIYNVDYKWQGEPCTSELLFEKKRSAKPVAILQVTQVEKNAALLAIVERPSDEGIEIGARVEINNLPLLKGEKSRTLGRAVRLGNFTSEKLEVPGHEKIDLTPYLYDQAQSLLSSYGFYPRK